MPGFLKGNHFHLKLSQTWRVQRHYAVLGRDVHGHGDPAAARSAGESPSSSTGKMPVDEGSFATMLLWRVILGGPRSYPVLRQQVRDVFMTLRDRPY